MLLVQSRWWSPFSSCALPLSAKFGKRFRVRYEMRTRLDAVVADCKQCVEHNVNKVRVISMLMRDLCRNLLQKLLTMRCTTRSMSDRLEGFPPKNSCGP